MQKKQILGIAFILFGILLNLVQQNTYTMPILYNLPYDFLGLLAGITGLGILIHDVRKEYKECQQKSEEK